MGQYIARRGRKRLWCACGMIGVLLVISVPARAARFALWPIDPLGIDSRLVLQLEGLLRAELGRLADSALPDRVAIRRVIARKPELASCTGEIACLCEAGSALGVDRIIAGNVGGLAGEYVINLKLVDVAQHHEIRRVQYTLSGQADQLIEAVRVATYGLVAPSRLRGALRLLANVDGAEVLLDGKRLGVTPLAIQRGLPLGDHTLRLSKAGYTDVVKRVRISFQKVVQLVVHLAGSADGERDAVAGGGSRGKIERVPWYTRWWFWAAVGITAGGLGAALGWALADTGGINCTAEPAQCR